MRYMHLTFYNRFQTGGSILAGKLALERGWAINLGGGFHHCSRDKGGGFCPYADITLLVQFLFQYEYKRVKSAMIVDLDAHQVSLFSLSSTHSVCIHNQ
jgi:histone deacetylase 11